MSYWNYSHIFVVQEKTETATWAIETVFKSIGKDFRQAFNDLEYVTLGAVITKDILSVAL